MALALFLRNRPNILHDVLYKFIQSYDVYNGTQMKPLCDSRLLASVEHLLVGPEKATSWLPGATPGRTACRLRWTVHSEPFRARWALRAKRPACKIGPGWPFSPRVEAIQGHFATWNGNFRAISSHFKLFHLLEMDLNGHLRPIAGDFCALPVVSPMPLAAALL